MCFEFWLRFFFPPHLTNGLQILFALRQHLKVFISIKNVLEKPLYSSVLHLLNKDQFNTNQQNVC